MCQLDRYKRRRSFLPLLTATALAATATPAFGVGWHLDCLDQMFLPLDNTYLPPGTGAGMTVWIVSTGIDVTHPEFEGRAQNTIDLVGGDGSDAIGHGTWVASIVGGATFGVARQVQIRGVRAFDECGATTPETLISAVNHIMMNADMNSVALIPFAFGADATIDNAMANLAYSGVPVIVAAGDSSEDACLYSPARHGAVYAVGALDTSFSLSASSNYGPCVDLYAPGVSITAAWPGGGTATHDGTAASAAIVAGLAAIHGGDVATAWDCSRLGINCGTPPGGGGGDNPLEWYRIYATPCPGDVDCDGTTAVTDLLALLAAWGPCPGCPEDLDGDGAVNTDDLLSLLADWGACANN